MQMIKSRGGEGKEQMEGWEKRGGRRERKRSHTLQLLGEDGREAIPCSCRGSVSHLPRGWGAATGHDVGRFAPVELRSERKNDTW